MSFLQRSKGGAPLPPQPALKIIALAAVGAFVAIAVLGAFAKFGSLALIMGSFGASCMIVFGFSDAPFAQPRNVIVGHLLSTFSGLLFLNIAGSHWWSMALAVACAVALMMLTRTPHPPAASNPVIVMLAQPTWSFLLFPTLVGAVLIVVVALIYNNLQPEKNYPKYW